MPIDLTILEPCPYLLRNTAKQIWLCKVECMANNSEQRCVCPSFLCRKRDQEIVEVTKLLGSFAPENILLYWHPNQE